MINRRGFVKLAGLGAIASTLPSFETKASTEAEADYSLSLGIAGYTFLYYKDNIEKVCKVMN